jgi:fructose-bisphosphate aldolase class I
MDALDLESVARALVAPGKGILAADESHPTIAKRFAALGIENTGETRRLYRQVLFTTPGLSDFISGVILFDETIRQKAADDTPVPELLARQGILPGIKVDKGTKPLAGAAGEVVTEGLDGLRERIGEYKALGARFAKWRAVITIGPEIPSGSCLEANAHALARYAALCQEGGLVPIVEPEVLMDGDHTIERCFEITEATLHTVFEALRHQRVVPEAILLKASMVLAGKGCSRQAGVDEVSAATLRCLRRAVPTAVPGVVFFVRRADRRPRDGPPERHECHRRAPSVGAELLVRASLAGPGDEGMAGEASPRRRRATGPPSPRPLQRRGTRRALHARARARAHLIWIGQGR